ncbi:hypothetical protein MCOR25_005017 [Pyricularia grisea]|nr:hypothetical protein MCOR25_005017 [Pyricularia grisea]
MDDSSVTVAEETILRRNQSPPTSTSLPGIPFSFLEFFLRNTLGAKQLPRIEEHVDVQGREAQAPQDLVKRRPVTIQNKPDHSRTACLPHISKPLFHQIYYLDYPFLVDKDLRWETLSYMDLIHSSSSNSTWPQKSQLPVRILNKPKIVLPLRPTSAPVVEIPEASQRPANTTNAGSSQSALNSTCRYYPPTARSEHNSGKKRKRRDNDDDDAGQNGGGQEPQSGGSKRNTEKEVLLPLACPYYKMYNGLHCPSPRCSGPQGWPDISRLKGHLYRCHLAPRCDRCGNFFERTEDIEAHSNHPQPCEERPKARWNYMRLDKSQRKQLKEKTYITPGTSPAAHREKCWAAIWVILFPYSDETLQMRIPSPYYDGRLTRSFVEQSVSHRRSDVNLRRDLLAHVSGSPDAVDQILEILARHERAFESRWQAPQTAQRPSAITTPFDNLTNRAPDGPEMVVHPPPEAPEFIPQLQNMQSSSLSNLEPGYSFSSANSYYTGSTTRQSAFSTRHNINQLMPSYYGTSVAGETVGTSVSGGLDMQCPFPSRPNPAQPDSIPQPPGFDALLGISSRSPLPHIPGQGELLGLGMGNLPLPTTYAFDADALLGVADVGENFMAPQNQISHQLLHLVDNEVYPILPGESSSSHRGRVIYQVVDYTAQMFPNTHTNQQHDNGGAPTGNS